MFNALVFPLLNNVPERIRKCLHPAQQLFLGLVILPKIWKLIGELVETIDEFIDFLLIGTGSFKELDEHPLALVQVINGGVSLQLDVVHGDHASSDV